MQKDKLVLEDYETFSVRGKNRIVIWLFIRMCGIENRLKAA